MSHDIASSNLEMRQAIAPLIRQAIPDLKLLVLFGSQAKGTATERSDWDLAVLMDASSADNWIGWQVCVPLANILQISESCIDLIDLAYCSPVLGYAIAREGHVLYEREPDLFFNFQLKAWKRYADTARLRQYQKDYIRLGLERLRQ